MLGYTTVGTNDLATATEFYDRLLAPLGGQRVIESPRIVFYSNASGDLLAVTLPKDEGPCSFGNGTMIGLKAPSPEIVDEVHHVALACGGKDEGAPGYRLPGMYIAYFRDLEGNKLAAFNFPSTEIFIHNAREFIVTHILGSKTGSGDAG